MNNPEILGFDNWFWDKVDLSKTADLIACRVNPETKTLQKNILNC